MKTLTKRVSDRILLRLQLMILVMIEEKTVTEAAQLLGESRKSWYKWSNRGWSAMVTALEPGQPGRLPKPGPDSQQSEMQQQIQKLTAENTLLKEALKLKELLGPIQGRGQPGKKKEKSLSR